MQGNQEVYRVSVQSIGHAHVCSTPCAHVRSTKKIAATARPYLEGIKAGDDSVSPPHDRRVGGDQSRDQSDEQQQIQNGSGDESYQLVVWIIVFRRILGLG